MSRQTALVCMMFVSSFAGGALAQHDVIALFTFDGGAPVDLSGHGVQASASGAVYTPTGYEGGAFAFDGADDFIEVGLDINPAAHPQLTMGAFARASDGNPIRCVMSHDDGGYDRWLGIDYRGDGTGWSAFSGSGEVLGWLPVTLNQWTFVAVVYDQVQGTVTLYGGNQSVSEGGQMGDGWATMRIGSNPSFGEYFAGDIDTVFIFDGALSLQEISAIRSVPPGCPRVWRPPVDDSVCAGGTGSFSVLATGSPEPQIRWRRAGAPLSDGPTGTGSVISGAHTAHLSIAHAGPADQGTYDAVVTNDCDQAFSGGGVLTVEDCCYADCDRDGSLDLFDFLCFVNQFNAADPTADCDGNGGLDLFDFLCFVNAFNAGC